MQVTLKNTFFCRFRRTEFTCTGKMLINYLSRPSLSKLFWFQSDEKWFALSWGWWRRRWIWRWCDGDDDDDENENDTGKSGVQGSFLWRKKSNFVHWITRDRSTRGKFLVRLAKAFVGQLPCLRGEIDTMLPAPCFRFQGRQLTSLMTSKNRTRAWHSVADFCIWL